MNYKSKQIEVKFFKLSIPDFDQQRYFTSSKPQRFSACFQVADSAPSHYKYIQKFKFYNGVSKISQNLPLETNRCCTQYYIFGTFKITATFIRLVWFFIRNCLFRQSLVSAFDFTENFPKNVFRAKFGLSFCIHQVDT